MTGTAAVFRAPDAARIAPARVPHPKPASRRVSPKVRRYLRQVRRHSILVDTCGTSQYHRRYRTYKCIRLPQFNTITPQAVVVQSIARDSSHLAIERLVVRRHAFNLRSEYAQPLSPGADVPWRVTNTNGHNFFTSDSRDLGIVTGDPTRDAGTAASYYIQTIRQTNVVRPACSRRPGPGDNMDTG